MESDDGGVEGKNATLTASSVKEGDAPGANASPVTDTQSVPASFGTITGQDVRFRIIII